MVKILLQNINYVVKVRNGFGSNWINFRKKTKQRKQVKKKQIIFFFEQKTHSQSHLWYGTGFLFLNCASFVLKYLIIICFPSVWKHPFDLYRQLWHLARSRSVFPSFSLIPSMGLVSMHDLKKNIFRVLVDNHFVSEMLKCHGCRYREHCGYFHGMNYKIIIFLIVCTSNYMIQNGNIFIWNFVNCYRHRKNG